MKIDDVTLTCSPGTTSRRRAIGAGIGRSRAEQSRSAAHAHRRGPRGPRLPRLGAASRPTMDGPSLLRCAQAAGDRPGSARARAAAAGDAGAAARDDTARDRRGGRGAVGSRRQDRRSADPRAARHLPRPRCRPTRLAGAADRRGLRRGGARFKATGWTAYKIHPPTDPRPTSRCARRCASAVGDDYTLMLDSTWAIEYPEALRVGRVIEELGFYWYEDPLADEDIYNYVKLEQQLSNPDPGHRVPRRRLHRLAVVDHRAGDRLPARRRRGQGRDHPAGEDRASGRGVPHELRDPPRRQLAEQRGQPARHAWRIRNCEFFEVLLPDGAQKYGLVQDIEVDAQGLVHAPTGPGPGRRDRLRADRAQDRGGAALSGVFPGGRDPHIRPQHEERAMGLFSSTKSAPSRALRGREAGRGVAARAQPGGVSRAAQARHGARGDQSAQPGEAGRHFRLCRLRHAGL